MKNSFSIFIVVLFCAVLCVGLGFLNRDSSDSLGWNPNELYSNSVLSGGSSAFTNASLSSGDVPVGSSVVSMRGGSVSSSLFRHSSSAIYPSAVSLHAPASVSYGSSSMSNGVSPIAHMTSSAEYRSFGGGSNGGALGSSSSRHYASASSSAALSITAPISYNGSSVFDHSSKSYGTSDVSNIQSSVMDNPVVASSSIYGPSSSVTDYINTYGTASYGSTGRSNVRGRQNSVGFGDTWWNWLDAWIKDNGAGMGVGDAGDDGYYSGYALDRYDLEAAYNDFIANFWNSGMGIAPTYKEWLDWYITYTGENGYQFNNRNYAWLPVGNILPFLLMALAYIVILFVKRNKTAQL